MNFYSSKLQPPKESKWTQVLALSTAWSEHVSEGQKYYYNHVTGVSTPVSPSDPTEEAFKMKPIGKGNPWSIVFTTKRHYFFYNRETRWVGWFPTEELLEKIISPLSNEELKDLLDPTTALSDEEDIEDIPEESDKEDDEEAEDDEEIEEAPGKVEDEAPVKRLKTTEEQVPRYLSTQDRVDQFKQMLREHNVSPYNPYENELPKFSSDPRFKLLTTHKEIRSAFDSYCKTRALELKDAVRTNLQTAKDAYIKLLYEKCTLKTYFEDIQRLMKKSATFAVLDKKECEHLFREHMKLLKEKELSKRNEAHLKSIEAFKELLSTIPITPETKFSDVKSLIDKDPRFNVKGREELFNQYKETVQSSLNAQQSLSFKEKMQQVIGKSDSSGPQTNDQARLDSMAIFKSMLIDYYKGNKEQVYKDLVKDKRSNSLHLNDSDKEKILEEYIVEYQHRKKAEFAQLLSTLNLPLHATWSDVVSRKPELASTENLYKSKFTEFMNEKKQKAESDLFKLIAENQFIKFQYVLPRKVTDIDFEEVDLVLRNDKRYSIFTDVNHRNQVVERCIKSLVDDQ